MKKSRLFNPVNQFFIQYNLGPLGMKLVLLLCCGVFLRIVLDGFFFCCYFGKKMKIQIRNAYVLKYLTIEVVDFLKRVLYKLSNTLN